MTDRIYYRDPRTTEFDAAVVSVQDHAGKRGVVLDRTAFYPSSGGQPFDTGSLGSAAVVDVIDLENGDILHVIEGEVAAGVVHGAVDWPRRLDHMQQHTGQHVLSAAFDRLMNVRTLSFHLGSAVSTIDLEREVLPGEIAAAEAEANRVIWENRAVTIRFASAEEAAALDLRKEPTRSGVLRIIDIEGWDVSACGGTHVSSTGSIGIIAVTAFERFRGGTRLEFVCGGRALARWRSWRDTVAASTRLLSVSPAELPGSIERLQAETRDLTRRARTLQMDLAVHEAAALSSAAETRGTLTLVAAPLEGWDAAGIKAVAAAITSRPSHAAVLLTVPPPCAVVVARAADLRVDSAAILKQLTGRFGGKGGGRPELAQGGGLSGDVNDMLTAARDLVAAESSGRR